jgi:DNA recombination protein RmuC
MTIEFILLIIVALLVLIMVIRSFTSNTNDAKLDAFITASNEKLNSINNDVKRIEESVRKEISLNRIETSNESKRARGELSESLQSFKQDLSQTIQQFNTIQKDNFFELLRKQSDQNTDTSTKLDTMRNTIEQKVSAMQTSNEQKLEQMRITVDEKLQQTLEARLGESFKLVSERLEAVHKGLGDMQTLATGVGDLKRVLSNVKTRGVLGEYQLEAILEQILTPDQYAKNVKTKLGSNALVEFAVKLPNKQNSSEPLWLPVDSKFPKEAFELLTDAYEHGSPELVEEYRRTFIKSIRSYAQDICNKYIDAPNTTDFAILFLPFESLYAEVLRTPGLFESMQRECRVIITGPTTLSALLNSLQMGFRTLAIEKRSGEVWQLLSAVKTEFGNFSGLLDKAQKNIQTGLNQLEDVVGKRTKAIERRLKDVQVLNADETMNTLQEGNDEGGGSEEE